MTSKSRLCVLATAVALLSFSTLSAAPKKKPAGPKLVPFKGKWTGLVETSTTPVTNPDGTPATNPDGTPITETEELAEGGGNATHLGRYSMESTAVSSTDETDTSGITGTMTFTAANGDQVFATFDGDAATGADGLVDSDYGATIVGGTGRFAGSTGYFTFLSTTDPDSGKSIATFNGKISGPGKGN
ncbi:MAG TPA: hypothetical protein VM452_14550 [Caulifigura sp.]|jgi:hypothetical protein|nr:hypothetical protein [Caulifigura sp.]